MKAVFKFLQNIWFGMKTILFFFIEIIVARDADNFKNIFDFFELLGICFFFILLDCLPFGRLLYCSDEDILEMKERNKIIFKKYQNREFIEEELHNVPIEGNRVKHIDLLVECCLYGDVEVSKINGCVLNFPCMMPCLC